MSVEVSSAAYRTIVLHAAKNPSLPCAGVLVGTKDAVSAAVPLAHGEDALGPAEEAGLDMVRTC